LALSTRPLLLGALLLLGACEGDEPSTLLVDLRSDLTGGADFTGVRVELRNGVAPDVVVAESSDFVTGEDDLRAGLRIAEFGGLNAGTYALSLELVDAAGGVVVPRTVLVSLPASRTLAVTVLVAGACAGVDCPRLGDAASLTTCHAGECVEPGCQAETGCETCPPPGPCGAGPAPSDAGLAGLDATGPPGAFAWSTTEFGACSASCGEGEQTREVACVDDTGAEVPEANCADPRPDETMPCDAGSGSCGWGGYGGWGSCSAACDGNQTRSRSCDVPGHCSGDSSESRSCDGDACCDTAGSCTGWTMQSCCSCATGRRCEVRDCLLSDCRDRTESRNCITDCPCCR